MKKLLPLSLLALTLAASPPPRAEVRPQPKVQTLPSFESSPMPSAVFTDRGDIRELAKDDAAVWAATSGGLVSIDLATLEQKTYGTSDGLDTMDVRHVRFVSGHLAVDTATARCEKMPGGFRCAPEEAAPPEPHETETFAGHPVTARLETARGTFVGTRGAGLWLGAQQILGAGPGSFVKTAAVFRGSVWLGLFDGGVARMPLDFSAPMQAVPAPFRMVNELLEVDGNMFVAANEGLYISRDGKTFSRVLPIGARSITGLAADSSGVWLTSTEALYKIDRAGKQKAQLAFVHPAGTRSIQGLALAKRGVFLATEDRGVVFFDGKDFHAKDKLAGLPTSWFVGVTSDGADGVFAATLRDGALHISPDGTWERTVAYGTWGETATRIGDRACFGMQEGASCGALEFRGLPDPRVHLIFPVGKKILVGTEAGMALYDRA